MSLTIRKQPGDSVQPPSTFHVQLFIDSADGNPKIKDGTGTITDLVSSATGVAGGDLSGTYPNPGVVSAPALKTVGAPVNVSASPAPSVGQILVATTGTTAVWQNIPSSSPSGLAGGDLAGSYPNPTVTKALGLKNNTTTVSTAAASAPEVGQILVATSDTTATWQDPPISTPVGPAGGDLAGTFPDPVVLTSSALRTSSTNVSTEDAVAPTAGQALIATGPFAATWQSLSGDFGGTWSAPTAVRARGLKSATTTVTVDASAAPTTGQVLIATSSTSAVWQNPGSYVRNSVWDPPAVSNSADEEFTTDPFLGGGWIVKDSTGATQTRVGDVSPADYPTSGTYRSTQVGSTVYFQVHRHESLTYYLYKQVPGAVSTEQIWTCGLGTVRNLAGPAQVGANYAMFISADIASSPDFNNMVEVGVKNLNPPGVSCDFYSAVTIEGVASNSATFSDIAMAVSGLPGFMIRKGQSEFGGGSGIDVSTPASVSFAMFSPYGAVAAGPPSVSLLDSFTGAWAWSGFKVKPEDDNNSAEHMWAQIFALHFIRRKVGINAYIFG